MSHLTNYFLDFVFKEYCSVMVSLQDDFHISFNLGLPFK